MVDGQFRHASGIAGLSLDDPIQPNVNDRTELMKPDCNIGR